MNNLSKCEALDRIHIIRSMSDYSCSIVGSQFLVYVSDDAEDEYHQGLSQEAKELVGKAMELLCDAYQRQGESLEWGEGTENQVQGEWAFEDEKDVI